jgi:outer membrane biosynthesis protein TonB
MAPSTSNDVDLPCPEQPTPPKPTGPALSCPFPIEADRFQINQARVVLAFCVDANGYASASRVVEDPGYGFAEAALQCVAKVRFNPGLDASGNSAPSRFVLSVRYLR